MRVSPSAKTIDAIRASCARDAGVNADEPSANGRTTNDAGMRAATVIGAEGAEGGDDPSEEAATTRNVYRSCGVRPHTVHLVAVDEHVAPPGEAVATYRVTGLPPRLAATDHEIFA